MINYLLSILYIIIFLLSLFFIGNTFFKKYGNLPIRIIYSFILYKFVISFLGVVISFFKLPFITFYVLMFAFWIILLGYTIYKYYNDNIKISKEETKENLKRYWFIPIITIVLLFFSVINIQYHWFGNHLDDGFYVNEIYDYVNEVDTYSIDPATGFTRINTFNQYSLNTWQMESAFYSKLMHIEPSILLKIGQSFVNYFLLSILIIAFLEKLLQRKNIDKYKYELQFIPTVLILFIFQFDVLNYLLALQDGWQFGNAMYYGSTLVRTMGIFLLLLPFIDKTKIKFIDFIIYGVISFTLLAQSAVALPVVIIVGLSYLISYFIFECTKKRRSIPLILILGLSFIAGIILSNISFINDHAIYLVIVNKYSVLFYIILIVWLTGFLYKDKLINKINTILLIIICFMYIPELNDITENLSFYDFVEARLWTGVFYVITALAFTYAFIFLCKKCNKKVFMLLKIIVILLLLIGATLSFYFKGTNIIDALRNIKNNPMFLPNSTVVLGEKLESISKEQKVDLYVLTPDWVWIKKYNHSLGVLLRQQAKDIKVVSALPRFPASNNPAFFDYSQDNNDIFNFYMNEMNKSNSNELKTILNKYPINCLVSIKKIPTKFLKEINFEYMDYFCDDDICYFIYYKQESSI